MKCESAYADYDGDLPVLFTSVKRKARKQHKCCECKRQIEAGETYLVEEGKWDGEFETFKTCSDCLSIRETFFGYGFILGEILETLSDHIYGGDVPERCIAELTPRAREMVCEIIEEKWEIRE